MRALILCLFFVLPPLASLHATDAPPKTDLSAKDAIILGLVEGITEFLPVSSTGHLIIANHLLGLNAEEQLLDEAGQPLWIRPPSTAHPAGVPLTLKSAADTYAIVIQGGAILAVAFVFWLRITDILAGLLGKSTSGLRLLRNMVIACVPAVTLGLTFSNWIDHHLFSLQTVIVALVLGAGLMWYAEAWRKRRPPVQPFNQIDPADLTAGQSLIIGFWQCLALCPGTSRSMVTMVGGYFVGLTPPKAAEFSFLVGIPILTGAALFKSVKSGPAMLQVFGWGPVLLGATVAAFAAAFSVKFLISYLTRHGLGVFACYRVFIAAILFLWFVL